MLAKQISIYIMTNGHTWIKETKQLVSHFVCYYQPKKTYFCCKAVKTIEESSTVFIPSKALHQLIAIPIDYQEVFYYY